MVIQVVSTVLELVRSPLAYPWRCLAGNSIRSLARRLNRVRGIARDILVARARPGPPLRLQVETTDFCNLRCIMCTREVLEGMNSSAIQFETFQRLIDEGKPLYVTLNGLGEPLLDKSIFQKLELLHARGIMSSMPTNGTYLRRANLDRLAANLPDILQLSIDGGTPETFQAIRVKGDFAQIISGYRALAHRRATGQSRPHTSIRILCALQRKNLFDYRDMYRLYKSIPDVSFSLVPVFEYDSENGAFAEVTPTVEEVRRLLDEIDGRISLTRSREEREFYRSWRGAAASWLDRGTHQRGTVHTHPCTIPWYSSFIDAKGRVFPCCYLTETRHVMGNVQQAGFLEIWHGERYREFRNRLVNDRGSLEGCRHCPRNDARLMKTLRRVRALLPAVPPEEAAAADDDSLVPQGAEASRT